MSEIRSEFVLVFMYSACYSCQLLMVFEFSRKIFEQYSYIGFHSNPSSGSRDFLCRRTDMTELIVAFRNFANASKNQQLDAVWGKKFIVF